MIDDGWPIEAKGTNGTIIFDGVMVTLDRGGAGRLLVGRGQKRVPVRSIAAVQRRSAGLTPGYLQLTIPGGVEVTGRGAPLHDENTITFHARQQRAMQCVREEIERAITEW